MEFLAILGSAILAYLAGSIPFGLLDRQRAHRGDECDARRGLAGWGDHGLF
jgi:glycerol-3-phosphate acyltransferase PlsY